MEEASRRDNRGMLLFRALPPAPVRVLLSTPASLANTLLISAMTSLPPLRGGGSAAGLEGPVPEAPL